MRGAAGALYPGIAAKAQMNWSHTASWELAALSESLRRETILTTTVWTRLCHSRTRSNQPAYRAMHCHCLAYHCMTPPPSSAYRGGADHRPHHCRLLKPCASVLLLRIRIVCSRVDIAHTGADGGYRHLDSHQSECSNTIIYPVDL